MKKSVEQTLLERRSIRRYEYDPIPEGDMDFIYAAIRNTPTSYNGQQFSVIDICDQDIKQKLYEITNQKQIKPGRSKAWNPRFFPLQPTDTP